MTKQRSMRERVRGFLFSAVGSLCCVALGLAMPLHARAYAETDADALARAARASGKPDIPGLQIVWLHELGDPKQAARWKHIIVHQTEGPRGSSKNGAAEQFKNPFRRGVMIWVETDGTVYWATRESDVPLHGDGANRNDNKYIDNSKTYRQVVGSNSIGVEFAGNFPDVKASATDAQKRAWLVLVKFLRLRYGIAKDHVYAHNWIDFKDARYCEGCELATLARAQGD